MAAFVWGGKLASVHSQGEMDFIVDMVANDAPEGLDTFWLGGRRTASSSSTDGSSASWEWSDGSPWDFNSWQPSQPDNDGDGENYVGCGLDGAWFDLSDRLPMGVYKRLGLGDWGIGTPSMIYTSGDELQFRYKVGSSASKILFSLHTRNCTTPLDENDVLGILSTEVEDGYLEANVLLDKSKINDSPLTEKIAGKGDSAGTVRFCAKAQLLTEDNLSVSWLKSNFDLNFDLSDNSFAVGGNTLVEFDIDTQAEDIITDYTVEACRCERDSTECISGIPPPLQQNGVIFICLYPTSDDVFISNFEMDFIQDDSLVMSAVSFGTVSPVANTLAAILGDGTRYMVASRLISQLFQSPSDTFNVTGSAYLEFKGLSTRQRRLARIKPREDRFLQEGKDRVLQEGTESPFSLSIRVGRFRQQISMESHPSLFVIAACFFLFIAIVLMMIINREFRK
mmetsp:Transcript_8532/g.18776  ORF Transcript_8532/g.18776 Transcript_8532/m.18776 type:complete len:452 (+) Transcript_8532:258-1613(+)|eukprot:CAMPEP_0113302876 /NCGR_PEP_ID=MMETSP0010_2-20120614/3523_1 /TAXON_ID=216773 ORGANISM="Corethron hystrix, Strain 308" /NCGR_SAMPLE_ID=MMETSP0010_2 /ASSEMBLY_ACC=CAM_ASM_000155 /LENGTH=451 /DNA_ID=CAMNT_0000156773 /DNA_START=661 /DNA_END=2016 /DNA_ORIENTATION=+ /assembly_acc=CAM_ASM_000155